MINVFLICSGLGNVKRGYESFTQECFDALSKESSLNITLFKGGGKSSKKEIVLSNLPRNAPFTQQLSQITSKGIGRGSYWLEQSSFGMSLLPHLYLKKPNVVYFSDENLGNLLWYWRLWTKQSYKLLFSNGGPNLPPFDRWDHIQQVAPAHLQKALKAGEPPEKHSLVPYGIHLSSKLQVLTKTEREALRHTLALPQQRPLLLSVGTINKRHKRMDYVIREVAALPEPRPYLLLLGQQDEESSEIFQLGNQLLGTKNFEIRTVTQPEVSNYYKIADAFILASLSEGFGRVFLEAMSYGVPCLAHDYEVTRFVLGENGYLANFKFPGNLTNLISKVLKESKDNSKSQLRHRHIYNHFSWEKLRPNYIKLIQKCAYS